MIIMSMGLIVAAYYVLIDAFGKEVIERRSKRAQMRMAGMAHELSQIRMAGLARDISHIPGNLKVAFAHHHHHHHH